MSSPVFQVKLLLILVVCTAGEMQAQRRFPMKPVITKCLAAGQGVTIGSVSIDTRDGEELTMHGSTWQVQLPRYCEAWKADLDGDGKEDLIFSAPNGAPPPKHLLIIMFDSKGRPSPWQVDGYFTSDSRGIQEFHLSTVDGQADLLARGHITVDQSHQYSITSIYHAAEGYWTRRHGRIGGGIYPIYESVDTGRRASTVIDKLRPGMPQEPDLGNDPPTRIPLALLKEKCKTKTISIAVADTAAGRRIAIDPEARTALTDEIAREHMNVSASGVTPDSRSPGGCLISILWAEKP